MKTIRIAVLGILLIVTAVFASSALVATSDAGPPDQEVSAVLNSIDQTVIGIPISDVDAMRSTIALDDAVTVNIRSPESQAVAATVGANPIFASNFSPGVASTREGYRDSAYKPNTCKQPRDPAGYRGFGLDHNARAEI